MTDEDGNKPFPDLSVQCQTEMRKSNYGRYSGWIIEQDGQPLAQLTYLGHRGIQGDDYYLTGTMHDLNLWAQLHSQDFWDETEAKKLVFTNTLPLLNEIPLGKSPRVTVSSEPDVLTIRDLYFDIEPANKGNTPISTATVGRCNPCRVKESDGPNFFTPECRAHIKAIGYGRYPGWILEQNDKPLAALTYLGVWDMFWDSYSLTFLTKDQSIQARLSSQDFWRGNDHTEIVFRNRELNHMPLVKSVLVVIPPAENTVMLVIRGLYFDIDPPHHTGPLHAEIQSKKMWERILMWARKIVTPRRPEN